MLYFTLHYSIIQFPSGGIKQINFRADVFSGRRIKENPVLTNDRKMVKIIIDRPSV